MGSWSSGECNSSVGREAEGWGWRREGLLLEGLCLGCGEDGRPSEVARAEGLVSPSLTSGRCPVSQRCCCSTGAGCPHIQQPEGELELDWTPPSMPGPRSPVGTTGPLLSCDQSADKGICFCLPSWKTPMALPLPLGWRCMEALPGHVSRPFAHQGFGGSGITTLHLRATSKGGCLAWRGGGADWQPRPPSPLPFLAGFHTGLLCCWQRAPAALSPLAKSHRLLPDFIPAGQVVQGSRGTTGCWRSALFPSSGDVPAGSLCNRQSSGGYCSPPLPHLVPARLSPSGEHDLCPTTSSQNTGQGTKSPGITIRSPASSDWRSPVCQQLFSQEPALGSARISKGIAKLKR